MCTSQAYDHLDNNLWLRRHSVAQTFLLLHVFRKKYVIKRGTSTTEHFLPIQQGATCQLSIAKSGVAHFSEARCR